MFEFSRFWPNDYENGRDFVSEQMAIPGSRTNPNLIAARFLLKPGCKYEEAVKQFQPYDKVKEPNPEARAAGKALIAEGKEAGWGARPSFT